MNFIEELRWRGMLHDTMPGTDEQLQKEMTTAYVGIDPTANSLHIGHLVSVMMLRHLQQAGHRPIVLIGGATGMVGDPSGKSQERNLLDEETLRNNQEAIKKQLSQFLDFDSNAPNAAIMVNNYDWMKEFGFLDFVRDIGKHITVNYMLAKDSVKSRMTKEGSGLSFTEFSYQLLQGYDFLYLYENYNCKLQMGGSDQWGNITTGSELIRRKLGGEAFALTCPLITKADGRKFGKTEEGNVWLDPDLTSPYKFYQFWLNVSDQEAEKYLKIFTTFSKPKIESLAQQHAKAPDQRNLQKFLAREMTALVHSRRELDNAIEASQILFGKNPAQSLRRIDEKTLLSVFDGVPMFDVPRAKIENRIGLSDLLCAETKVFGSKGELRRLVKGGGLSVNQAKEQDANRPIAPGDLLSEKYLLVRKGKKNYSLVRVV